MLEFLPPKVLLGTTIESDHDWGVSKAPPPEERYKAMVELSEKGYPTMVSVEPVMAFDTSVLGGWLWEIKPLFVSIGADSKGKGINEPSPEWLLEFIQSLHNADFAVKLKSNLQRLFDIPLEELFPWSAQE